MTQQETAGVEKQSRGAGRVEGDPSYPSGPRGLALTPLLYGFRLEWERPRTVLPVTGYRVYRRVQKEQATLLAEIIPAAESYCDLTVNGEGHYSYSVTALTPAGESPRSSEVSRPFRQQRPDGVGESAGWRQTPSSDAAVS